MTQQEFIDTLRKYGQNKFVEEFEALPEENRIRILEQAEQLDLSMLAGAAKEVQEQPRGKIEPIRSMTLEEWQPKEEYFRAIGLKAIREGKVGALLLSGGMGTRLGFDGPKGMYDIGITEPVYIFQRLFENMLEVVREAGCAFHLFIMASVSNYETSAEFLKSHAFFGYPEEYVHFFVQDMAPCLNDEGNMFLEAVDKIAVSPNGNGGFYSSLLRSSVGHVIKDAGIEYINVFAVDNVLQRIADPVFIGAAMDAGCATGAKVVRKVSPDERVGAMCLEDGKPSVVEYYDMTPELKAETLPNGEPAYNYGVILNYLFRLKDIDEVIEVTLPVHMARKKVPYLAMNDGIPVTVEPEAPNAYKLETLSLDLVHLTDSCLPFEVVREREFAPIKNAAGVDSVESARELLKKNGIKL